MIVGAFHTGYSSLDDLDFMGRESGRKGDSKGVADITSAYFSYRRQPDKLGDERHESILVHFSNADVPER